MRAGRPGGGVCRTHTHLQPIADGFEWGFSSSAQLALAIQADAIELTQSSLRKSVSAGAHSSLFEIPSPWDGVHAPIMGA